MLPKINQVLYLRPASLNEHHPDSMMYKSRVADIKDKGLHIEYTQHSEFFALGRRLQVEYTSEDGIICKFTSKVIGFTEDNIKLAVLEKPNPEAIHRIQRRDYLRVPADLEIAVQSKDLHVITVTEDISGGGLSFIYNEPDQFVQDQELCCWLLLRDKHQQSDPIQLRGRIVRLKETGYRRLVMLEYTKINEVDRQKIIRFCLERQLELHKKHEA